MSESDDDWDADSDDGGGVAASASKTHGASKPAEFDDESEEEAPPPPDADSDDSSDQAAVTTAAAAKSTSKPTPKSKPKPQPKPKPVSKKKATADFDDSSSEITDQETDETLIAKSSSATKPASSMQSYEERMVDDNELLFGGIETAKAVVKGNTVTFTKPTAAAAAEPVSAWHSGRDGWRGRGRGFRGGRGRGRGGRGRGRGRGRRDWSEWREGDDERASQSKRCKLVNFPLGSAGDCRNLGNQIESLLSQKVFDGDLKGSDMFEFLRTLVPPLVQHLDMEDTYTLSQRLDSLLKRKQKDARRRPRKGVASKKKPRLGKAWTGQKTGDSIDKRQTKKSDDEYDDLFDSD